jgi:hypothetical protein
MMMVMMTRRGDRLVGLGTTWENNRKGEKERERERKREER